LDPDLARKNGWNDFYALTGVVADVDDLLPWRVAFHVYRDGILSGSDQVPIAQRYRKSVNSNAGLTDSIDIDL
jgi:hypothetical protein